MEKSREKLEKQLAGANAKLEQYRHKGQRLENRIRYYQQGERRKRTHRLVTHGAAVESIAPAVRSMGEVEFYSLVEQVFSLSEVAALVNRAANQQEGG